jgi:hypothetical protein
MMSAPIEDIGAVMTALLGIFLIGYSIYLIITRKEIHVRGIIIDNELHSRVYRALIGIWIVVGILLIILSLVFGYTYHRW